MIEQSRLALAAAIGSRRFALGECAVFGYAVTRRWQGYR